MISHFKINNSAFAQILDYYDSQFNLKCPLNNFKVINKYNIYHNRKRPLIPFVRMKIIIVNCGLADKRAELEELSLTPNDGVNLGKYLGLFTRKIEGMH